MRNPPWRLIIPLTIISFGIFTKWWKVYPVDGPDTMMDGFPFPWVSEGWGSSMSLQIFALEFAVDFAVYFLFWILILTEANRYFGSIKISKRVSGFFWALSTLVVFLAILTIRISSPTFEWRRDWDMKVLKSGIKIDWPLSPCCQ
jgi:hypothetical protein